jgi:hypothetical protein
MACALRQPENYIGEMILHLVKESSISSHANRPLKYGARSGIQMLKSRRLTKLLYSETQENFWATPNVAGGRWRVKMHWHDFINDIF